ncbi:MAG: hypothetical protein M3337_06410, partial [Actinomycetota bacterium]|nr:hypothetical protein [Actinomycetota bacterium]
VVGALEGPRVELDELYVEQYKNLSDVRLEWSPRLVLYGRNATGKTNLLEAVALMFGNRPTLWQLSRRAEPPAAGRLSAVVRSASYEFPFSPEFCSFDAVDSSSMSAASGRFWRSLNSDCDRGWGQTWHEALKRVVHDDRLVGVLSSVWERPLVRYQLEAVDGLEDARRCGARRGWIAARSTFTRRTCSLSAASHGRC